MNKEFEYKGHKFNIKVELGTYVGRRFNGEVYHTIFINDMGGSNYYKTYWSLTDDLEAYIDLAESEAKESIDKRYDVPAEDDPTVKLLKELGFK